MAEPEISVVVCTHDPSRLPQLRATLRSIDGQTYRPSEVIVVVDHRIGLADRIRRDRTDVVVLDSDEPPGLSGTRNAGTRAARGEVVAFLDDDAVADATWLEHLAPAYADGEVIGVGGVVDPHWAGGRPAWFPAEFDWVVGCTRADLPRRRAIVRNLIGANMSFRKSVLTGSGGFRPELGRGGVVPFSCEETELCIRISGPERTLVFEPGARVVHRVPRERQTWRYFRFRCLAEGRSKAIVTRLVGAQSGLADERRYAARTIPTAVAAAVSAAARDRDRGSAWRAATLLAGLGYTAWGYLAGTLDARRRVAL